jgi:hypothetical protein
MPTLLIPRAALDGAAVSGSVNGPRPLSRPEGRLEFRCGDRVDGAITAASAFSVVDRWGGARETQIWATLHHPGAADLLLHLPGPPRTGRFPVGAGTGGALTLWHPEYASFSLARGTVRVTAAAGGRLRGTFSGVLRETGGIGTLDVHSGTFDVPLRGGYGS